MALIGTWGSVQWIPLWVGALTHNNQQATNNAQMCSGLGAVAGSFLGAVVGVRLGRRWTYFGLCLGSLLACAYLFRWQLRVHPQVDGWFLAVVAGGALTASFYGWLPLYLPELFPTRVRATGQGFSYNAGRAIAAAGALSTGFLMSEEVFHESYDQAGAAISLIYVIGLVVIWFAPETRGQRLPE